MSTVEDEPTREQKTREAMIELTSKLVTDETARNESHGPETVAESQEPETVYSPENKVDQLRSKLANNSFTFGNIEVKNNQIKIGDTELAEDAMIEPNAFRPVSGEEMDHKMAMSQTYRFLSKCASAQEWVNSFVPCPDIATFFSELPRGFHLAKIASLCGFNKTVHGLEKAAYYEVINISTFLEFCRKIRVKECYLFETNDLRESKNMQKVVYCLHAVARKLQRIGHGQGIQHLKKSFTKEEIDLVDDENVGVFEEHLYDQLENDSNSSEEIEGDVVEELVEEKEEQLLEEEEQLLVEKEEVVEKDQLLVEEQLLEEVDNNINNNLAVDLQNSHPTPEQVHALDSFVKTLSFTDAFKNILYNEKIKLISLKKFIFLMPQDKPEYIGTDIIDQFRRNYAMKEQIDETYRSVRLLLENQAEMRGLRRSRPRPKSDFGPFKQVLYNFMVDHAMVSDLILQNEAIPLEHVYNDTIVGDYHFSKVLLRIKENETQQRSPASTTASHFRP
ncbi:IQGA3 [Enterospora canceri]|uniref:IQGA3 n=1 Tax=Enterospora canceri TaxID=1081671 RepID=A0A1Y1S895_9MICR|nr:IQGA3 [Enterospora canceri]